MSFNVFNSKFDKLKEYEIPSEPQPPPKMIIIFSTGVIFEQADKVIMNKILNYFDKGESSYLPFEVIISNYKNDYVQLIEKENVIDNGNYHCLMIEHFLKSDDELKNSSKLNYQNWNTEENKTEEVFIDFEEISDEIINLNNKYAIEGHIFKSYNDKDYVFSGVKRENLGALKRQFIQDVEFDFQKELNKDTTNDVDYIRGVSKKNQRNTLINDYVNTNRRTGKSLRQRIKEDVKSHQVDNIGAVHKKNNDVMYDFIRKEQEKRDEQLNSDHPNYTTLNDKNGFDFVLDNAGQFTFSNNGTEYRGLNKDKKQQQDNKALKERPDKKRIQDNVNEDYKNNNIISHLYDTWY